MPAKPRWHADLDRIRATVAALGAPLIDRQAIEQLFGVRPRQANNLMRGLGGYRIGSAAVVRREDLLLQLDQMAGPRGYAAQAKRKARVVETLDDLRRNVRPHRVAAPPPSVSNSPLPAGVRISAPGELTLSLSSPEDLLGRIMGLAQSAVGDWAAFAASLEDRAYPHIGNTPDAASAPIGNPATENSA
jgi:hypothetical protein